MIEAADLDRTTNTGRIYHLHRATPAQQWPDTIPTGYGDEAMKHPKPMPRVVPCSTLARWFLALRRWLLG